LDKQLIDLNKIKHRVGGDKPIKNFPEQFAKLVDEFKNLVKRIRRLEEKVK
jgi:hypothetical protein